MTANQKHVAAEGRRAKGSRSAALWVLAHPGKFAAGALRHFRSNQALLLAGAVAYYALLSLVPLVILVLMLLTRLFPEDRVLATLATYLEFVVPGQAAALVEGARAFVTDRGVVGVVLLATLLFFSSLAFTALENAMAVIFFHRVAIKRRHFMVSAALPYLFIVLLTSGLIVVTVASGMLQQLDTRSMVLFGHAHSMGGISSSALYILGVGGEAMLLSAIYLVMPVGQLSVRHALIGGATATALWEATRHALAWYFATVSQIQVVYGTLATAVGVLLSAELGAVVLLAGAQVIAEYERLARAS